MAGRVISTSNDGKAGFNRKAPFGPPDAAARVGAVADFNADGSIDLAVGDEKAESMVVYMNDGTVALQLDFGPPRRRGRPTQSRLAISTAMAVPISCSDTLKVRTRCSSTTARADVHQDHVRRSEGSAYGFALGDMNGDKFPDIALARSGAPMSCYLSGR
jgi:hypothetical protein